MTATGGVGAVVAETGRVSCLAPHDRTAVESADDARPGGHRTGAQLARTRFGFDASLRGPVGGWGLGTGRRGASSRGRSVAPSSGAGSPRAG